MMKAWALQDAKARLSELVQKTLKEGPQLITYRGEPSVMVISAKKYDILTGRKKNFVTLMGQSPLKIINHRILPDGEE
jgi:antitoxin Phd